MRRMELLKGLLWGLMLWCVTGCVNYPLDPARLPADALADVPDHRLCLAYSQNRTPRLRAELKRRGTFTASEWRAITGREVIIGMSEMALVTALPGIERTRTIRSNGVVTNEWYFARLTDTTVRTENGKVVWFR
jgi:hypothetical protein